MTAPRPTAPQTDDLEQLLDEAPKVDLVAVVRRLTTRPYDRRLVTHHLREASRARTAGVAR